MAGRAEVVGTIFRQKGVLGVSKDINNELVVYVVKGQTDGIERLLRKLKIRARIVEVESEFRALGGGDGS